jgi:hypothetical protein
MPPNNGNGEGIPEGTKGTGFEILNPLYVKVPVVGTVLKKLFKGKLHAIRLLL